MSSTLSQKGVKFSKGARSSPIKQSNLYTPSPFQYNVESAERALLNTQIRTVAPAASTECRRMMEEIVAKAIKQDIPAPGAYDIKGSALKDVAARRKQPLAQTTTADLRYLNTEQLHTPSPAAYNPDGAFVRQNVSPMPLSFCIDTLMKITHQTDLNFT